MLLRFTEKSRDAVGEPFWNVVNVVPLRRTAMCVQPPEVIVPAGGQSTFLPPATANRRT